MKQATFNKLNTGIPRGFLATASAASIFFGLLFFAGFQSFNRGQPTIINHVPLSSSLSLSTRPLTNTYTAGTGGTTAGLLVTLDASSPSEVITALSTSSTVIGVAMSSVSAAASVEVSVQGQTTCIADGSITAGDALKPGVATAGRCADISFTTGIFANTGTQIIGYALANATVGNSFAVYLIGPGFFGGGSLVNVTSPRIPFANAAGNFSGDSTFIFTSGTHTLTAQNYSSATNCSSAASPAVCGSAAAGSIAVPVGTNQTLQVNTSAVTANSQIFLQSDDTLGTKLSITCNTTAATLALPIDITARTAATSFTVTLTGTTSTNKPCYSYFIMN